MSAAKRRPAVSALAESAGEKGAAVRPPLARTALWRARPAPAGEQVPKAVGAEKCFYV
jgi:hypothetical protein